MTTGEHCKTNSQFSSPYLPSQTETAVNLKRDLSGRYLAVRCNVGALFAQYEFLRTAKKLDAQCHLEASKRLDTERVKGSKGKNAELDRFVFGFFAGKLMGRGCCSSGVVNWVSVLVKPVLGNELVSILFCLHL